MFLLNPWIKDWVAVVCVVGTTACTPSQVGTTLESFQPIKNLKNRQQQVILDAESQYRSVRQWGDTFQICDQAELVASTYFYLQGYDSVGYQFWKSIEQKDCESAQAKESHEMTVQVIQSVDRLQAVMKQPID